MSVLQNFAAEITGGSIKSFLLLLIILTLVNIGAFFVKGIAGFGDPLVSGPALSMILNNQLISSGGVLLSLPANAYLSYKNRKGVDAKKMILILIFMFAGIIPGILLLKYATASFVKILLGMVILLLGVEMATRRQAKAAKPNNTLLAIVCFVSGITAGLYGINLIFVAYIERTTTNREAFRGTVTTVFLCENLFRLALYALSGILNKSSIMLALLSLPGLAIGLILGVRADKKLSERAVTNIVIAVFMLGGASILAKTLLLGA